MPPKRNQVLTEAQKKRKAELRKLQNERLKKAGKTDPEVARKLEEARMRHATAAKAHRDRNKNYQNVFIDESQSSEATRMQSSQNTQSQVTPTTRRQQARRSDPSKYNRDLQLKRLQNQRRSLGSVSSIASSPQTSLATQLTAFTFCSQSSQSSQSIVISQSQSQSIVTPSQSTPSQSQPLFSQNDSPRLSEVTPRPSRVNSPYASLNDFVQREVAKKLLEKHVKELEHYCFDDTFLQPVTESHVLLRRKQLCRIRVHRRGNDPVHDFLEGDYPNILQNKPLSQYSVATPADDEYEMFQEYDDVDATVLDNEVFIRQCDLEICPDMTDEMVLCLDNVLFSILYSLKYKFYEAAQRKLFDVYSDLGNMTLLDFLQKFYGCYMGIRTCYNKIRLIRKSLDVILSPDEIEFTNLPKFIQFKIITTSDREQTPAGITEAQALRRFANEFTIFRKNEADIETAECQVCRYLCRKSLVRDKFVDFNIHFLPPEIRQNSFVRACETCRKSLSKDQLPTYAVVNGFELEDIPRCMKELNFIGKNLIQLVKPIIGTYNVTDKRGVANGMRGKQGVGTFHAVPVDDTAAYLATHLPNLDNMLVQIDSVDTSFVGQVVNLYDVFES
uniref:DUF6570 domain-containing protein n=1 Tax=Panagrolaimus sp. PS1159 TaxID=55785 RepID=A0AC35F8R2_9BILA